MWRILCLLCAIFSLSGCGSSSDDGAQPINFIPAKTANMPNVKSKIMESIGVNTVDIKVTEIEDEKLMFVSIPNSKYNASTKDDQHEATMKIVDIIQATYADADKLKSLSISFIKQKSGGGLWYFDTVRGWTFFRNEEGGWIPREI